MAAEELSSAGDVALATERLWLLLIQLAEISEGENITHGEDILPFLLGLRSCGSSVIDGDSSRPSSRGPACY
jgi:hypothetical protein